MSKNTFSVTDNTIYIYRPEWDFVAQATVRDDYADEIQSVTWGLQNNRYPYNAKLGMLHSYVMKKWYGEEFCTEMKEKGFVIDHMDNESHNCSIENLHFLSDAYNKAKGMTFDKENKDKRFIALTLSRDFYYKKAREMVKEKMSDVEFEWMRAHIKVASLYDIEHISLTGQSIIDVCREAAEDQGTSYFFPRILAKKTTMKSVKYLEFIESLKRDFAELIYELKREGCFK